MNSSSSPAALGSIIQIFGTGMGPYSRTLADGSIVGTPLASLTSVVQATFPGAGGCQPTNLIPSSPPARRRFPVPLSLAYAAPLEVVGVDQVNVQIPFGAALGAKVSLTLQIGGTSLQAQVSIN